LRVFIKKVLLISLESFVFEDCKMHKNTW